MGQVCYIVVAGVEIGVDKVALVFVRFVEMMTIEEIGVTDIEVGSFDCWEHFVVVECHTVVGVEAGKILEVVGLQRMVVEVVVAFELVEVVVEQGKAVGNFVVVVVGNYNLDLQVHMVLVGVLFCDNLPYLKVDTLAQQRGKIGGNCWQVVTASLKVEKD